MRERAIYTRARYSGRPRSERAGGGRGKGGGKEKSGGNPLWSLAQVRAAADRSPRVRTLGPRGLALSPRSFFCLPLPSFRFSPSPLCFAPRVPRTRRETLSFLPRGKLRERLANLSHALPFRFRNGHSRVASFLQNVTLARETLGISCAELTSAFPRQRRDSLADFSRAHFKSDLARTLRPSKRTKSRREDTPLPYRDVRYVQSLESLILGRALARRSRRPRLSATCRRNISQAARAHLSRAPYRNRRICTD